MYLCAGRQTRRERRELLFLETMPSLSWTWDISRSFTLSNACAFIWQLCNWFQCLEVLLDKQTVLSYMECENFFQYVVYYNTSFTKLSIQLEFGFLRDFFFQIFNYYFILENQSLFLYVFSIFHFQIFHAIKVWCS